MGSLKKRFSVLHDHSDIKELKALLLKKIEADIQATYDCNQSIKLLALSENISKPIQYNQLVRITRATYSLIKDHLEPLIDANHPMEGYHYSYDPSQVAWLGDPDQTSYYGTSRVTPLKDAYLRLALIKEKLNYLYELNTILPGWINNTVLANSHPLPQRLIKKQPDLNQYTYYHTSDSLENDKNSIIMPHNYYELGGGRAPYDRTQDCSALVARYTTGIPFTTRELHINSLLIHQNRLTQNYCFSHHLYSKKLADSISTHFQPVHLIDPTEPTHIRDPQVDIKPGMVMCTRDIERQNFEGQQQTVGVKGHTAFVISEPRCDGSLWTAGCERRLNQNIDGIGYSHTSITPKTKDQIRRITHFFEVKKPDLIDSMRHHTSNIRSALTHKSSYDLSF